MPLARHRASNFRPDWLRAEPRFLQEPVLKAASGQALEERPVQQFLQEQARFGATLHPAMQRLHQRLLTLTLPYTTPHTLSSNQQEHTPNQNKLYTKKMRVNDMNQLPQSILNFSSVINLKRRITLCRTGTW
jgi:hypothetical protein